MSKNTKCKECEHNNHGWCKKHKAQINQASILCESQSTNISEQTLIEFGKREMIYYVELQAYSSIQDRNKNYEEKYKKLIESIANLSKMLDLTEELYNVKEYVKSSEINHDIFINSKYISDILLKEVK